MDTVPSSSVGTFWAEDYISDTRLPTPPPSGGTGSVPLRSETNDWYLIQKVNTLTMSQMAKKDH